MPDAALGVLGYLADAVTGIIGGRARWCTMPWIVVLFGIAVGPLGAISVLLVILQPVLFDAWCTLCLASAIVSVAMIGPALDEVLSSLQHVAAVRRAGGDARRTFWRGAPPPVPEAPAPPRLRRGSCIVWARITSIVVGIWLMAAPAVLGNDDPARAVNLVIGPLAASAANVAL